MEWKIVNPFSKAPFSMWEISLYFHSSKIKLLVERAMFTSLQESPTTLQAELNLQEIGILSFADRKSGAGSWEGAFQVLNHNTAHLSSDTKSGCPWLSCCLGSLWSWYKARQSKGWWKLQEQPVLFKQGEFVEKGQMRWRMCKRRTLLVWAGKVNFLHSSWNGAVF